MQNIPLLSYRITSYPNPPPFYFPQTQNATTTMKPKSKLKKQIFMLLTLLILPLTTLCAPTYPHHYRHSDPHRSPTHNYVYVSTSINSTDMALLKREDVAEITEKLEQLQENAQGEQEVNSKGALNILSHMSKTVGGGEGGLSALMEWTMDIVVTGMVVGVLYIERG
ncbi:unnamed protein product [Sphagnum balticum]